MAEAHAVADRCHGPGYRGSGPGRTERHTQPPTATWGNMLKDAQTYLTRMPWLAVFPGVMIFLKVMSVNAIGDGLRDAFDPRKSL